MTRETNIVFFNKALIALAVLALAFSFFPLTSAVGPSGAETTVGTSEGALADTAGSANATAGNVTNVDIFGYTTTQTWQGFYGNVTGVIQLANANDDVFYNWSLASPQGEVYSSTNTSISWSNIQCFNFTANGAGGAETPGETNLGGTNLSVLEETFGIAFDDVDGINETFSLQDHDEFFTASQQFSADECLSTRVYGDTGSGVDQEFEEVLLYEPTSSSVVFASLLEEDLGGFDQATHDFQMLVLDNGHGTDTAPTTYFFFVELE